jgi:threonine dehydrogenase-like Zn-dependent dehydrogenase
MRAAIFRDPGVIEVGERPDPRVEQATDAVVRVVMACLCGSDLWYYRGESEHAVGSIGHESIGVVEDLGADVHGFSRGDLVIAPFIFRGRAIPTPRCGRC